MIFYLYDIIINMDTNNSTKKGIICIIASAFFFSLMFLFIKLTGDVPTLQKCFFRNFFALVIAVVALLRAKVPFRIGKGNTKYLVGRSLAGGIGMVCNFYAIDYCNAISDASILNKLSPFFAIIFSIFILKEIAKGTDWLAVICAFTGALFVIKPTFSSASIPTIAGAIGGMGAGLAYTLVRKLGMRKENSMIIVAFFSGFTTLMLLPNLIFNYTYMTPVQWLYLCFTGLAAALGQIFITKAYSYAPAKEISVYDFSIVVFSAIWGFMFLSQIPDVYSVIGYIIIIGTAVTRWYMSTSK